MNNGIRLAVLFCLLPLTAFTCSLGSITGLLIQADTSPEVGADFDPATLDTAIRVPIEANLNAIESHDLIGYMATIHPDSPGYEESEAGMRGSFAEGYTIHYDVILGKATVQQNGFVRVPCVLIATKISGGLFQDYVATGSYIMRLDGTQWKIFDEYNDNVINLDTSE
jgi:hypothetical protein